MDALDAPTLSVAEAASNSNADTLQQQGQNANTFSNIDHIGGSGSGKSNSDRGSNSSGGNSGSSGGDVNVDSSSSINSGKIKTTSTGLC